MSPPVAQTITHEEKEERQAEAAARAIYQREGFAVTNRARILNRDGIHQLAEGADGYFLYNIHDRYIGASIAKYGEYSGLEAGFFRRLCATGDVVIEVGANIGAHTVGIAKAVGPSGRVLAFEPQRIVFQMLCANIALNCLANVDCHHAAVGAMHGSITVPEVDFSSPNNFGAVTLLETVQGLEVPCITLDGLRPVSRVNLLKIDVEGMEFDVIKGGMELIGEFKPFLYVENDQPGKSEALMRLIDSMGYRMHWDCPPLFNPKNYYGEKENIFGSAGSFNLFCVHRSVAMQVTNGLEISDFSSHPLRDRRP